MILLCIQKKNNNVEQRHLNDNGGKVTRVVYEKTETGWELFCIVCMLDGVYDVW
jgi:hypothetical protein